MGGRRPHLLGHVLLGGDRCVLCGALCALGARQARHHGLRRWSREVHNREPPRRRRLRCGRRGHPVHRRPPAVVGPPREQVADVDGEGVWRRGHGQPLASLRLDLEGGVAAAALEDGEAIVLRQGSMVGGSGSGREKRGGEARRRRRARALQARKGACKLRGARAERERERERVRAIRSPLTSVCAPYRSLSSPLAAAPASAAASPSATAAASSAASASASAPSSGGG